MCVLAAYVAPAQWSNTSNQFEDSLSAPASKALLVQKNPIIVNSYPDGGYFIIWEDERNMATTNTDIYAQKYDNAGHRLWAADGVPVANGPYSDHYTYSSNQDYRNRPYAATDSAGGFYIAYADDSVTSYVYERAMVQHVLSSGAAIFPSPGYIITRSAAANYHTAPQLIADGNKGFFYAYRQAYGNEYIHIYCYRDEAGTLVSYGGGRVNENAIQTSTIAPCGIKTDIYYPGTTISDYNIWYDRQGGCNVVMAMNGNTGSQYQMLCYNRVWRAKKNALSKSYFRNTSGVACPKYDSYTRGQVYLLYTLNTDYYTVACGSGVNAYSYTNYRLLSNGYQEIAHGGYDYNYPKGVTVTTGGNINVDLMAATTRNYINGTPSDFTVQGYLYKSGIFDSVPFQRASFSNPEIGYNPIAPPGLIKLNYFRDTLLASSNYFTDFSLSAGGSDIYVAALMGNFGIRKVKLQRLRASLKTVDSIAVEYNSSSAGATAKGGVAIGSELSTGFTGTNITYDLPLVRVNKNGDALFYIRELGRSTRVSPVGSNVELSWGAMGVPTGTGVYNNSYYNVEQPFAAIDSTGKTGLVAWKDDRAIPGNTGENIFMRHLDNLKEYLYSPPHGRVRLLPNSFGPTVANPAVLYGTSKKYSRIDLYSNAASDPGTSPVLDIDDENYLGRVQVSVFQNSTSIRRYNNEAYLNRNYTIKTDSTPPGAKIDLQFYFTKQDFDALKGTDNAIINPGYLMVIRQPNTSASINAPATYAPVAGEELLTANSWDSVEAGGYQIGVTATGFGHFFIKKMVPFSLCSTANTSFTSNKVSASYLWQVNDGNGYVFLANNANYSGANTATLQLTNVPASFNDNLYRCVLADLSVSNAFLLQVANVWTGAVNNLWETAGNWSCGTVPTATTDVIINSGTPAVNSATAVCRSIKVGAGASVSVTPGFKLTVIH